MGRGGHSDDEGTPYDQRLEEVEFMRSACAAAQRGDIDKLRDMLDRRPDIVGTTVSAATADTPRCTTPRGRATTRACRCCWGVERT
jgi:hypothetical protein